jgi:serine/threonine-protein kinase
MALTPGMLLAERYRLTARLAVGGMGEVWTAEDTRLARQVAVKILKSELTSDPEFVDRFRSEARITASLNDPGIASVHDYGEVASIPGGARDTAYLVMELVNGEPLSAVLARTPRLSATRTLDVLEQSGRALQVAHARSLVHRDIKPGNILITPAGQVKITDFGIAKVAHQVPVTRGGLVMGTAQYLAPEQAAGREALPASDVYALGVVAFECLAGRRPFDGDNPVAVATAHVQQPPPPLPPDVPPAVAALVMRMLAKDPAQRYPDGASLAAACGIVRSGGVPPLPPGATPMVAAHGPVPRPGPTGPTGIAGQAPAAAPVGATGYGPPAGVTGPAAAVQVVVTRRPAAPRHRQTGLSLLLVLLILIVCAVVAVILATRPVASSGAADGQCPVVSAPVSGCDLALTPSIVADGVRRGPA